MSPNPKMWAFGSDCWNSLVLENEVLNQIVGCPILGQAQALMGVSGRPKGQNLQSSSQNHPGKKKTPQPWTSIIVSKNLQSSIRVKSFLPELPPCLVDPLLSPFRG